MQIIAALHPESRLARSGCQGHAAAVQSAWSASVKPGHPRAADSCHGAPPRFRGLCTMLCAAWCAQRARPGADPALSECLRLPSDVARRIRGVFEHDRRTRRWYAVQHPPQKPLPRDPSRSWVRIPCPPLSGVFAASESVSVSLSGSDTIVCESPSSKSPGVWFDRSQPCGRVVRSGEVQSLGVCERWRFHVGAQPGSMSRL
jgi:hypothetical protein